MGITYKVMHMCTQIHTLRVVTLIKIRMWKDSQKKERKLQGVSSLGEDDSDI